MGAELLRRAIDELGRHQWGLSYTPEKNSAIREKMVGLLEAVAEDPNSDPDDSPVDAAAHALALEVLR